jgi:hypothetical protein
MKTDYIRYGKEWETEVMKSKKAAIVEMLRRVAKERDALQTNPTRAALDAAKQPVTDCDQLEVEPK